MSCFIPYYGLFLCDIQIYVHQIEINQASGDHDIKMATHSDITMGNDIAMDIHCDVTMSNDVAICSYRGITIL